MERIHHDEQLHEVLVDRLARGLDDEDVGAADVLEQLKCTSPSRSAASWVRPAARRGTANLFGQRPISGAAEDLEALRLWNGASTSSASALACPRFDPAPRPWGLRLELLLAPQPA